MIAINDIEQFEGLESEAGIASLIPTENEIMIGAGFINAAIINGLRVFLSQISNYFTANFLLDFYLEYEKKLSTLSRLVGFKKKCKWHNFLSAKYQ
jgi:hypothetical protein